MQDHRRPQVHSNLEEKNEAAAPHFLGSNYITKTYSSTQYGSGIQTGRGAERGARKQSCADTVRSSSTGGPGIRSGGETVSPAHGVGEVEPPHAKEESGAVI